MFGYTSAIKEAAPFLTSEQLESLQDAQHYNEDAKELYDRMAEGIQEGKDLAELRAEFNEWLQEVDLDDEGSEGNQAGGGDGQQGTEAGGETMGDQNPGGGDA